MDKLEEMFQFLQMGARLDLKSAAVQRILDLTGNDQILEKMITTPVILNHLLNLTYDKNIQIAKNACLALVNVSAAEKGADALINLEIKSLSQLMRPPDNIVVTSLRLIVDPKSALADAACMILSNISRSSMNVEKTVNLLLESGLSLDKLVDVFTQKSYNELNENLHYLASVFSNLSQSPRVRKHFLDRTKCIVQRLQPYTEYAESAVRRRGVVGTLRNCCFEQENHEWLLSEAVNILPRLLIPLAGDEEFDDEDTDKLPVELQYLSKDREPESDIRLMLLEALTLLCTKKTCRCNIRDKNTYVILRELHKWEKDRRALLACENLVNILIRTEDEINLDNLDDVQVPDDMKEKFEKMDEDFLTDN